MKTKILILGITAMVSVFLVFYFTKDAHIWDLLSRNNQSTESVQAKTIFALCVGVFGFTCFGLIKKYERNKRKNN